MDFTPNPEQQAVADVVSSVLERDNTWDALVSGGVAALGVPERLGGDGLGLPELSTALTEIGRHGTTGPALATVGLGLGSLLDLATDAQQDRYRPGSPRVRCFRCLPCWRRLRATGASCSFGWWWH